MHAVRTIVPVIFLTATSSMTMAFNDSTSQSGYCPKHLRYDAKYHLCHDAQFAYGPFSPQLIAFCEDQGGGKACRGNKLPLRFAQTLRGINRCQLGTAFDRELGACADEAAVYGPFHSAQIDFCLEENKSKTGPERKLADMVCVSNRWSKKYCRWVHSRTKIATGFPIKVTYFHQCHNH